MLIKRGVGVIEPSSSPREMDKSAGVDRLGQEALRRHRQHRLFDRGRRIRQTHRGQAECATWLKRFTEDGREVIRVVDLENHVARLATPDEIRDGQFFANFEEFQAARSAA
jgi:hypothetical protein